MKKHIYLIFSLLLFISCSDAQEKEISSTTEETQESVLIPEEEIQIINPEGKTIQTRFNVPEGFERMDLKDGSFGSYLRNFKLKPHGTSVYTYNRREYYDYAHIAVLDIDVGDKDLQQCADAVMRLKSEYHYAKKEHDSIHFNFTNGFRVDYNKWKEGYRIGSNYKSWYKKHSTDTSYENFRDYMDMIFMFAGTLSLSKELKPKDINEISVGDVFIYGGSPGHAVIVVDVAEDKVTGERIFMMAQSYMPAQSIHVLKNYNNEKISPWYSNQIEGTISTPLWTFEIDELKTF